MSTSREFCGRYNLVEDGAGGWHFTGSFNIANGKGEGADSLDPYVLTGTGHLRKYFHVDDGIQVVLNAGLNGGLNHVGQPDPLYPDLWVLLVFHLAFNGQGDPTGVFMGSIRCVPEDI